MSCPGTDGLSCIDGWLYSGVGGMIFPSNKRCQLCNPRKQLDDAVRFGQVWVSDPSEPRAMYTDNEGKDYDVLDMRDALIAIRANTKPDAISLSPESRIKAIYEICCKAMP